MEQIKCKLYTGILSKKINICMEQYHWLLHNFSAQLTLWSPPDLEEEQFKEHCPANNLSTRNRKMQFKLGSSIVQRNTNSSLNICSNSASAYLITLVPFRISFLGVGRGECGWALRPKQVALCVLPLVVISIK
jgi:hypothetical protein